jgi:hypothetical protein
MCGCSKKGAGVQSQGTRSISAVQHIGQSTPRSYTKPATTPAAPSAGVRAQAQKRCPECSWPMNSMRRFDPQQGRQFQQWACMNRKCMHREET